VERCKAVGGPGRRATFARDKLTALLFEKFKSCGVEWAVWIKLHSIVAYA
jgi:hypothetical protein